MAMATHITKTCGSAFFYLYNILHIRKYLTSECTEKLIHAFITSGVDYLKSLLYGVPDYYMQKLQRVTNASARLIFCAPKHCHITPLLQQLHWLPTHLRYKPYDITKTHLPEVHCYADDTQLYLSFRPDVTSGSDEAISAMTNCIADIRDWMISDKLKLNDSKSEILLVGSRQQLRKVDLDALMVGTSKVPLATSAVRNLGAWFDSELTMNTHVNKLCSAAYFHLYNLRRIRKYLSQETCQQLAHTFITSRIDYCNSLLYGLPAKQLDKIQRVQNTAAGIIFRLPKFCRITPSPFSLH